MSNIAEGNCLFQFYLTFNQETHVDKNNKIVTTPAYMCETGLHDIFDGIGKMVADVLKLVKQNFRYRFLVHN